MTQTTAEQFRIRTGTLAITMEWTRINSITWVRHLLSDLCDGPDPRVIVGYPRSLAGSKVTVEVAVNGPGNVPHGNPVAGAQAIRILLRAGAEVVA